MTRTHKKTLCLALLILAVAPLLSGCECGDMTGPDGKLSLNSSVSNITPDEGTIPDRALF
ncbi:hypothetical protein AA0312_0673 [Acetobacter tropicalis NRIC 0312]|uniref:Uncharacterized protein n=1 Tax=Acetobacter tropicalis TaxID=104102 RepID=A0A511FPH1_9PROT|nr:hypothetical protein [Acetobacter tropicalis]KXV48678.1 hypothetical protein AD944_09260 [Acetobacter tropicalis]GAL97886.1 hypothetical protein ATR1_070d0064 [Acetobacter tropicalis]GBR67944.1 hypothetical protein AA0312_0673 [Acetobacter tropicalis NRIC 0312]GEL50816.1 hypothetical protein ATR01nite_18910 [Acetobacter tropicalis]